MEHMFQMFHFLYTHPYLFFHRMIEIPINSVTDVAVVALPVHTPIFFS